MDATVLHQKSIIIDGHCDTLLGLQMREKELPPHLKHLKEHKGHIDLPRLKEGGITAQNFACFITSQYLPAQATRQTRASGGPVGSSGVWLQPCSPSRQTRRGRTAGRTSPTATTGSPPRRS
mgnify:CR=1 FL=1